MIKNDEATNENSCWNKARSDERVFVLLARDAAAPETIRFWVNRRIELGKNQIADPQIHEALDCAARMEDEAKRINYRPHGGGMAGHDDEPLSLLPGSFYESRAGDVWCCYRIDLGESAHARAKCIEVSSGRAEYFFEDGRYDAAGEREHTLIRQVSTTKAEL